MKLVISEISAFAVNVIPFGLWFFEDYSSETTMVIYAAECLATILFAALCVQIISPAFDPRGTPKYRKKGTLIAHFLFHSLAMLMGCLIFLAAIIFLVQKTTVDLWMVGYAFLFILPFLLIEFVSNIITLRPLPLKKAEFLLTRSFGRVGPLFLGVLFGLFSAVVFDKWSIVPFAILKTIVDVGEPIQYFLGWKENEVSLDEMTASGQ